MDGLYLDAERLGVDIIYTDLATLERDGDYDSAHRRIRLQTGMGIRLHRSVLAHELGHATFDDVPSPFGPVNMKQEARAESWAAMRLIRLDDYREAEATHDGNLTLIANDLLVAHSTLLAYRRMLERIGDTVYLKPAFGREQFTYREHLERSWA